MIAVMLLAEYVIPKSEAKYDEIRAKAIKGTDISVGSAGDIWIKEDNKFLHINYADSDGIVYGVSLYTFDRNSHRLIDAAEANKGTYSEGQWKFDNTVHHKFTDQKLEITSIKDEIWDLSIAPDKFNALSVSADELPISSLWSYVKYLKKNKM